MPADFCARKSVIPACARIIRAALMVVASDLYLRAIATICLSVALTAFTSSAGSVSVMDGAVAAAYRLNGPPLLMSGTRARPLGVRDYVKLRTPSTRELP